MGHAVQGVANSDSRLGGDQLGESDLNKSGAGWRRGREGVQKAKLAFAVDHDPLPRPLVHH